MFEKCGLRDVLYKIKNMLVYIIILAIVFGAAGAALSMREADAKAAKAAEDQPDNVTPRTMYNAYAYYFVNSYDSEQAETNLNSLVYMFESLATQGHVYDALVELHGEDELGELLSIDMFKNGVKKYSLAKHVYSANIEKATSVITIRALAETKDMAWEVLNVCKGEFERIAFNMESSCSVVFEGEMNASCKITEPKSSGRSVSIKKVAVFGIGGIVLGIIIAIFMALFFPVINRLSDFEDYNLSPIGESKASNAAIMARVLSKRLEEEKTAKLAFVTTTSGNKKLREFVQGLAKELNKIGKEAKFCSSADEMTEDMINIVLAEKPSKDPVASDMCEACSQAIVVEVSGKARYANVEKMIHYLATMDSKITGVILVK